MIHCYSCGCDDKHLGKGFCSYHYYTIYRLNHVLEKRKQCRRYYHSLVTKRVYKATYYQKLRRLVLKKLGDKCCLCGFNDWRALQIDHVNGGGSKEKKEVTGNYYRFVLKEIEKHPNKYQLLCANCNWIKRYEKDETARK